MSTKKYGLGAAMLLLVLCSFASATTIDWPQEYVGRKAINTLYADRLLEVGPSGVVTFIAGPNPSGNPDDRARVDMTGTASQECAIKMSGGILEIAKGLSDDAGLELPDNEGGPVRVYVDGGTMLCGRIQNWCDARDAKIIVGGGTLIVENYYNPIPASDDKYNPAYWLINGGLDPNEGYELVFESPAPGYGVGSVKITGVRSSSNPDPADGSTISGTSLANLCWDSLDAKIYKVYFGQSADANESTYLSKLTYKGKSVVDPDPNEPALRMCYNIAATLVVPETYSWALEAYDAVVGGEPNGPVMDVKVYQFSTSSFPVILTQPVTMGYFVGEIAELTAEVQSPTALTATDWKQNNVSVGAGTVTPVVGYTDRYLLKLTINPFASGNQGKYKCTVANGVGSIDTVEVNLVAKFEFAHWDFNGNLLDTADKSVNTVNYTATAAVTPPVFVSGNKLDPNALNFDGTNQYLTLPNGFGNFRAGMTIAMYFRRDDSTGPNATLLEFSDSADPDNTVVSLSRDGTSGDQLVFRTRGGATPSQVRPNNAYNPTSWSHFVLTMDKNGLVKYYRDGFEGTDFGDGVNTVLVPIQNPRNSNFISNNRAGDAVKLNGRIGDLRIYNYPIPYNDPTSTDDVVDLFAQVNGGFCLTRPALDYVQTGSSDCVVDLADFAFFAADWLDCGLWLETACP